ncbi:YD repeat-containing protein [Pseudomonas nitritireducens]|uniref:YD repeat-containing protein n=2 Tax=Pseudomonas nitroreducens TaxID=46680 RepID=A0A7W7KQM6_PSENT|nr:YD repeat-containing protein [Pseudomonas nitritireducens]
MPNLKHIAILISALCISETSNAESFWGAPYRHSGYMFNGPWLTTKDAINAWWQSYQNVWHMPNCSFVREVYYPSDANNGQVYNLILGNGCGGGDGIFATKRDYLPEKNFGPAQMCASGGNPINALTGTKYQEAEDPISPSLRFRRYFNGSDVVAAGNMGKSWRHEYSYQLAYFKETISESAVLFRPNGLQMGFRTVGDQWIPDIGSKGSLTSQKDPAGNVIGLTYLDPESGNKERYSTDGNIQSITNNLSRALSFEYSDNSTPGSVAPSLGLLIKISDDLGHSISFTYNQDKNIAKATNDSGENINYGYDTTGNLIAVHYPDNTSMQYLYNEPSMVAVGTPNSLTGIIDRNGVRFASWTYDQLGRGLSSEHAGSAERVTLAYNADGSTTITNEYGKKAVYRYEVLQGKKLLTSLEGEPTPNCPASNSTFTYDTQGLLKTKTDAKGNLTTYDYNDRGLETSRTEASGTAQARTIATEWHPTLYLKTKVTEPDRITTYQYDAQGRQTGQTVTSR